MKPDDIMENDLDIKDSRDHSIIDRRAVRLPPWLITYSDLITLLLTFFILLLSMADLDPQRFNEASNSLKGALGLKPDVAGNQIISPVFPSVPPKDEHSPEIEAVFQDLRRDLDNSFSAEDGIRTLEPDAVTLVVRLDETLLFDQRSDTLLPTAVLVLDKIGRTVKSYPIEVRIEGHTDTVEATEHELLNSWELSTSRAVAVLRYFVQQRMIPIEQLSAVGYGDKRPVVKNTNESNRRLNRRVEILLRADFASGTTPAKRPTLRFPL